LYFVNLPLATVRIPKIQDMQFVEVLDEWPGASGPFFAGIDIMLFFESKGVSIRQ
jgi:hypothetical protein